MNEKYVNKIDIILESLRAHMNLLILELKQGLDDYAEKQLKRIKEDVKEIEKTFYKGKAKQT